MNHGEPFDQLESAKQVADQLLRIIFPYRARTPNAYAVAIEMIRVLQRAAWNPEALAEANQRFQVGLQADKDGRLSLSEQGADHRLVERIVQMLNAYLAALGSLRPRLYDAYQAAEYLGIKPGLVIYHAAYSKRLNSRLSGHSRVFTQADLDDFKEELDERRTNDTAA